MTTINGLFFHLLMFLLGALVIGVALFLFDNQHEFAAVFFGVGSYSIIGFIVGVRERALVAQSQSVEAYAAEDGGRLFGGLDEKR